MLIIEYNDLVGGTGLFDFKRKMFTTQRRSKKWWHALFYLVLDASGVNAGVLWDHYQKQKPGCKTKWTASNF